MAEEAERPARRGAPAGSDPPAGPAAYRRPPVVLAGAAVVLLIAVALLAWLLLRNDGETSSAQTTSASVASIRALNAFAGSIRHPIYWAGPQPRFTYELSRTKDGRVYVRYLPPGVKLGDPKPTYLTVGTYPQRHAFATLRATVKRQRAQTIRLAAGGLAFQDKNRPASVYLAYPGSDYQIEVFDPRPGRARKLVASGQIRAVGAPPRTPTGSTAASPGKLEALAVRLGHPIYWAGEEPKITFELTRTKDGSVYVRYLPQGARVGDRRPKYLTIGTYPQRSALANLKATAAKNGVRTVGLENGGVAMVDAKHPTSVYVAYPGVDVQIEVYHPVPGRARQLVTSGQVAPIR